MRAHANPVTGEAGKSYNDITEGHPGYQFRWSGTTWAILFGMFKLETQVLKLGLYLVQSEAVGKRCVDV